MRFDGFARYRASVNSPVEVRNSFLQISLVCVPRHLVDADRRGLLQVEERFPQTLFADVMQQGREFERAILAGRFTHAGQPARRSLTPARRLGGVGASGVPLGWNPFLRRLRRGFRPSKLFLISQGGKYRKIDTEVGSAITAECRCSSNQASHSSDEYRRRIFHRVQADASEKPTWQTRNGESQQSCRHLAAGPYRHDTSTARSPSLGTDSATTGPRRSTSVPRRSELDSPITPRRSCRGERPSRRTRR